MCKRFDTTSCLLLKRNMCLTFWWHTTNMLKIFYVLRLSKPLPTPFISQLKPRPAPENNRPRPRGFLNSAPIVFDENVGIPRPRAKGDVRDKDGGLEFRTELWIFDTWGELSFKLLFMLITWKKLQQNEFSYKYFFVYFWVFLLFDFRLCITFNQMKSMTTRDVS